MASREEIRDAAETSFSLFIKLVAPHRLLGEVHEELCSWMTREDKKKSLLILLPRDHMKSAIAAYYAAWRLTKDPSIRILILSSTSGLAEKQLKFVKDIITTDTYRYYWPDYVNLDEGKRERWTASEIALDHPIRKKEGIRDATVFTGGLTTSLTGFHADLIILDDLVVYENAYTEEGRNKVISQYSLLHSIAAADAEEIAVGTRYHPRDLYGEMLEMQAERYNEQGEIIGREPIYEVFQREVEDQGDGTGKFLWPRQRRKDGKWFGFDSRILADKRAKYLDKRQYRAQYYNDPNDASDAPIDSSKFQYFDSRYLSRDNGQWYYKDRKLNIYASIDFAFSLRRNSDFTALVVVGIDYDSNIYVLDIERIKTDKISDYYQLILRQHVKWDFRKLRAETTVAQAAIVKELKSQYLIPNGLVLAIDEFKPNRFQGSKEERMAAILEPRYENQKIFHFRGGEINALEEELIFRNPAHDDIKDALAAVIEIAIAPTGTRQTQKTNVLQFNSRFGGIN